jgi:hypothetical protein
VKALEAWRDRSKGAGDSPVFRWISKKDEIQWRVLIDQRIVAIIKRYAGEIGVARRRQNSAKGGKAYAECGIFSHFSS